MRHRGGAKLPTRDSLMHHPAGSPWCSPVAQSGGTEVQVLTLCFEGRLSSFSWRLGTSIGLSLSWQTKFPLLLY